MAAAALVLTAVGYGLLYASGPGRQGRPAGPPGLLRWAGGALLALALGASLRAWGHGVGPLVVLSAAMATASALVVVGPLAFGWATSRRDAGEAPAPQAARPAGPLPSASHIRPDR